MKYMSFLSLINNCCRWKLMVLIWRLVFKENKSKHIFGKHNQSIRLLHENSYYFALGWTTIILAWRYFRFIWMKRIWWKDITCWHRTCFPKSSKRTAAIAFAAPCCSYCYGWLLLSEILFCLTDIFRLKLEKNNYLTKFRKKQKRKQKCLNKGEC